jgi:4-hydroxy-tetrahydrodipicolinate synthase
VENLNGLGVALVTPFNKELEVDFDALKSILEHLYSSNALDYLVVLGSTGEASVLSNTEKQSILTFVKDYNNGRIPLVFGHGGNNTKELLSSLKAFDHSGYSAILSVSPAYVKPTQLGIQSHYERLADNSSLPIIIYNVPSRTGSNISAETTIRLSEHKNIIGIKDASCDLVQSMNVRNNTKNDFLLISGDDMTTVPLYSIGGNGLISVLGNAYPDIYKDISTSCSAGNFEKASKIAFKTLAINDLMYREGNPVGIKQLLSEMGLCQPYVRLPLVSASEELREEIRKNKI